MGKGKPKHRGAERQSPLSRGGEREFQTRRSQRAQKGVRGEQANTAKRARRKERIRKSIEGDPRQRKRGRRSNGE